MKRSALVLIFLLFALPALASMQVALQAEASRREVAKGETFTYKLSVIQEGSAEQPARLVEPDFTGFNVTGTYSSSSVKVIQGVARAVTEQEYRLSSELPGEHVIPPAKLVLTDPKTGKEQEVTSNPVKVVVTEKGPGLMKGVEEDIRDIKGPKSLFDRVRMFFYTAFAAVVLILALLIGLIIYLNRRNKTKKPPVAAPAPSAQAVPASTLSARDEALAAIDRAMSLRADSRAFYSEIIWAVRRYLKAVYAIPATEATTTEIMAEAAKSTLPSAARDGLWALLGEADLVKFAKAEPTEEEKTRFVEKARGLVREI